MISHTYIMMMMYYYKKYTLGYGVVDRDLLFTYYHQQVKKNEPHNLNERQTMHPTNTFKKVTSSPFLYILHFSVKATLFHERKPFIPRQAHTSLQQQQSFFIKLLLLIPIS